MEDFKITDADRLAVAKSRDAFRAKIVKDIRDDCEPYSLWLIERRTARFEDISGQDLFHSRIVDELIDRRDDDEIAGRLDFLKNYRDHGLIVRENGLFDEHHEALFQLGRD
jgi:hypothetical protein